MVPMAPSSTRMRSLASVRSLCSVGDVIRFDADWDIRRSQAAHLAKARAASAAPPTSRGLHHFRPQAEQMADRVDEVGAVHGVEMEVGDAAVDEVEHLLGGD